ncbi:hypothetical protein [Shewanella algae]|uniref:hypothetical protein n=1 Tax=Shewanella algae TaxID=38313 RepID=UPI0011842C79|nr:hypothetical protein [Shewanella algae]TVP08475.1 hypothetical protein AYI73_01015 [Shewanella algae]
MNKDIVIKLKLEDEDHCKYCPECDTDDVIFFITHLIKRDDKIISEYGYCSECNAPVVSHDEVSNYWHIGKEAKEIYNKYYIIK